MANTIASRKAKARVLQQYIAEKIGELTGFPVGKDCPIESREMGQTGPDVKLDDRVREVFPFTIEAKNAESWNIPKAIEQCKNNLYPDTDWLLIYKKNRIDPIIILDCDLFFELLKIAFANN